MYQHIIVIANRPKTYLNCICCTFIALRFLCSQACLMGGLPSGAPKGTTLTFDTGGGKLGFAVNDKKVGTVPSKNLANAFAGIYTDQVRP